MNASMEAVEKPDTSFEFVTEYVQKAATAARASGRTDSAMLWLDALEHLKYWHSQQATLQTHAQALADGLIAQANFNPYSDGQPCWCDLLHAPREGRPHEFECLQARAALAAARSAGVVK